MLVAIYNRNFEIADVPALKQLFASLQKHDAQLILFSTLVTQLRTVITFPDNYTIFDEHHPLPLDTDFIISLGGDGTILDTVTYVGNKNIPIVGINLGRLGFLAGTATQEIDIAIDCLASENYSKDVRSLLHLDANKPMFEKAPYALNDFTIQRKDSSALIKIHTYLNGEFLCSYWADGLIVSTPTGSTGYSLSCGGPVIAPQANSFVITPVAPHNLNVRSMVIPDTTIVSFEIEGRAKDYLCTLDARQEVVDSTFNIAVSRASHTITLVRFEGQSFYNTIRQKLYWGMDKRN
jgi:NAD+ kinase